MCRLSVSLLIVAIALATGAPLKAQSFGDAISAGEARLALRYRYEFVDQDGFLAEANASTLRARLSWRSGDWNNSQALLEFDAVAALIVDDYNSGANTSSARRARYPVVADPDYTEVNQLYLQHVFEGQTTLRLGRQRIELDNQRFVGGVGWRQNEQTFDAVSLSHEPSAGTRFFYAYVANVNRIFGDGVDAGDHDSATHLFNASHRFSPAATVTAYHYLIDHSDVPVASTGTTGLRLTMTKRVAARWPVTWSLEYARQTDAGHNPVSYTADYLRLDMSAEVGKLSVMTGIEALGGEHATPGRAFRTPLATLHAFNGWADQFLTTPDAGLIDFQAAVGGQSKGWNWQAIYHYFNSQDSGVFVASELDLLVRRAFGRKYGVVAKAARFRAAEPSFSDTTKLWLMLTASW